MQGQLKLVALNSTDLQKEILSELLNQACQKQLSEGGRSPKRAPFSLASAVAKHPSGKQLLEKYGPVLKSFTGTITWQSLSLQFASPSCAIYFTWSTICFSSSSIRFISASIRFTSACNPLHFRFNLLHFLFINASFCITYTVHIVATFTRHPQLAKTMLSNTPATFLQRTKRARTDTSTININTL